MSTNEPDMMSKSKFCFKNRLSHYKVTEAIERGDIALHLIDGRVVISEQEALRVLRPWLFQDEDPFAPRKNAPPRTEKEKADLFS